MTLLKTSHPQSQKSGQRKWHLDLIKEIPYAEPEQKIGHWIDTDNYYQRWKCSECGYHTRDAEPNYCPSCGADMRMRGK